MMRYPIYTTQAADVPAPTVEARRQPFEDRYPVHVKAATMEHVVMGVAWAGVIGAAGVAVRAVQSWPVDFWPGVGVIALNVFAVVICYMVTWHYSQDERMRRRDLRAWEDLEVKLAAERSANVHAQKEIEYLRRDLKQFEAKRINRGPTKVRTEAQKVIDDAAKLREDTIREIAWRFEVGTSYTREAMVTDGKTTAAVWDAVMRDMRDAHLAEPRGRGGKLVVTAYRAEDILRTMQVPR